MKITLISPYPDITAFGLRTISAYLKQYNFQTRMIFMPDPMGDDLIQGVEHYSSRTLTELYRLCHDADVIGISLMTNYFDAAVQVTRALRESGLRAPVVWGGVHPTIRPEECLECADIICLGESEDIMLELCERLRNGSDLTSVPGSCHRLEDGRLVKNSVRPLRQNLDVYPMPDYDFRDHFIMSGDSFIPMTHRLLEDHLAHGTVAQYVGKVGYQTMTGRGCPHQCTYCINDAVKCMYGSRGYLRWRSVDHVMQELEHVRKTMPYVGYIWISDDAFFARPTRHIRSFCEEYKKRIGLPFSCLASPLTMTEEKMDLLIDAGLIYLQMGVQSGSVKIQELFNRKSMTNEKMLKAMHIINRYKDRMVPPSYDFILDVPYETDADVIDSLRFIARIPRPYRLQPFALVLYPGTRLHDMAHQNGMIQDEQKDIYGKSYTMRKPTYLNFLFTIARTGKVPSWMLRILVSSPALLCLNNKMAAPLIGFMLRSGRWIKKTIRSMNRQRGVG